LDGYLKLASGRSDLRSVGLAQLSCPICSADFALGGDEKPGDEVYCSYCGAPCRLLGDPYDDECDLEEEI